MKVFFGSSLILLLDRFLNNVRIKAHITYKSKIKTKQIFVDSFTARIFKWMDMKHL